MNLPAAAAACGKCHSEKRWILHHVRLRGIIRRLCTSCVLLHHSSCFCPSCFLVYDASSGDPAHAPPPPESRVTCVKCSSISHSHCVLPHHNPPSSSYLCPPCSTPKFTFFDVDDSSPDAAANRALDKKLASVLLCAARIAAASMAKAAAGAREEAVKRASEASLARKRAREALDNLALVVSKEGPRKKEALSAEVVVPTPRPVNANASPVVKDRAVPERSAFGAVKLEHSGGNAGAAVSLSSAVGLRHNHIVGFDRFLAALPKPVEGGVRKVVGAGSGVNGIGVGGAVSEKEKLGIVVKVDCDNGEKPPLQNCNGKDDKSSN